MVGRSISERGEISKGLVRAIGIVFDEPLGEVEVAVVEVIEADFREVEPFILKGPIEAFEAGVVLGLADAGKEVMDVEQAAGALKLTGEFAAVVGMDERQVAFGQEEQAFEEVSRLAGGATWVEAGEGQAGAMFEGGKDEAGLTVPADLDGIDMPQELPGGVVELMNARFRGLLAPLGAFGDPFGVRVELEEANDPLNLPG